MGDPRHVRPDELEILVARELRKAGVELSTLIMRERRALSPKDPSEYHAELDAAIVHRGMARNLIIECRNQAPPVRAESVRALGERRATHASAYDTPRPRSLAASDSPAGAAPEPSRPLAMLVSMSGYDAAAVHEAKSLGIPLLSIADGPAAFRRSPWAVGTQPPAWVPEYMAELVDLDAAGTVRYQMLTAGMATRLLGG